MAGGLERRTHEYMTLQLPKQHGEGDCRRGSATWDGTWGKEKKGITSSSPSYRSRASASQAVKLVKQWRRPYRSEKLETLKNTLHFPD